MVEMTSKQNNQQAEAPEGGGSASPSSGFKVPGWKRPLDLTLLFLSAILWLPIAIVCALWIKIVSRGPLFLNQERIGLGLSLIHI